MSSYKFVHAADLHLDSPLRGLERYEGAPVDSMRASTRGALENLVSLCVEEKVRFLVLAGDIYDGKWKDFQTGLFFVHQMNRLKSADIAVYMVRGNHDAESVITKQLRLPDNVTVFGSRAAETVSVPGLAVSLHGRSYRTRAMTDNIAAEYPPAVAGHLNIGVLHTCLNGREGHEPYAPCTTDELCARGYDYWALGHVHERQVVSEDPWIVWSGTTQGRHARETGAKGCMLVSVADEGIESVEFQAIDVVRWELLRCDLSAASTGEEALELVTARLLALHEGQEDRGLAVRVLLEGATQAHAQLSTEPERWTSEVRAAAGALSGDVWVEKVHFRTQAVVDLEQLASREDAVGGLLRTLAALRQDAPAQEELLAVFDELRSKLPHELLEDSDMLDLSTVDAMRTLLQDVEQLLLPRLVQASMEDEA